jgi:hypothetical protein
MPLFRPTALLLLAAVAASITGCATTERYDRSLNALLGLHEPELVQQWGKPSRVYESGGFRYLVYEQRDTAYVAGRATGYQTVGTGADSRQVAVGGTPETAIPVQCTTTFELQDRKVVAWDHKGNYCKSR